MAHIGLLYFVKKMKLFFFFDSFRVEHTPEAIKEVIGNRNIKANIFRAQANDSVMCGYLVLDLLILCLQIKN